MTKSELIQLMASKRPNVPVKDMAKYIHELLDTMSTALCHGDRIEIRQFGSFAPHYRAPRNAHNPKTGEKVVTTGTISPHFKPGTELRQRVNEGKSG
jgi:integration host factor subunit beta